MGIVKNLNQIVVLLLLAMASCHSAATHEEEEVVKNEGVEERVALDILLIKNQFVLNDQLFKNVLVDISEADANIQINGNTNSIKWITGHILNIAHNLVKMLGGSDANPYKPFFGSGKPFDPAADYPPLVQMIEDWNTLSPQIAQGIEQLSLQQLDAPSPFPIPFFEMQSIRGTLSFQMHHIGYEIGQIGLYRRYLGKAAMSYK
ncbi:MAG: DinB family protein [Bacteroidota bacterium]